MKTVIILEGIAICLTSLVIYFQGKEIERIKRKLFLRKRTYNAIYGNYANNQNKRGHKKTY